MQGKNFKEKTESWNAANYCLAFIDLLGQRDALHGQGPLPLEGSEEAKNKFFQCLKSGVGKILSLQEDAEAMLSATANRKPSPLRKKLPKEMRPIWDRALGTKIIQQRWSDGLVAYVSLGDNSHSCRMNGVFHLIALCGALCFLGLAKRSPIRGAIEVSWGVELRPGEIYGPVVANSYELESQVAGHPRIIVGPFAMAMLATFSQNTDSDIFCRVDRAMAQQCLRLVERDIDGQYIVHYLGREFQYAVTQDNYSKLREAAQRFVADQLTEHREKQNSKLAIRYANLKRYFNSHSVAEVA